MDKWLCLNPSLILKELFLRKILLIYNRPPLKDGKTSATISFGHHVSVSRPGPGHRRTCVLSQTESWETVKSEREKF